MFIANQAALIGDRLTSDRIAELDRHRRQTSTDKAVGSERFRGWEPSSAITFRQSAIRFAGGVAVVFALVLSTNVAAAAPPAEGFFECGPGECQTSSPERAMMKISRSYVIGPGPHFIP